MRIIFAGRVTLPSLSKVGMWDRSLPSVKWGFPLGSEIVLRLVSRGHHVVVVTEHTVDGIEKYRCETRTGGLEVWLVPCRRRSRWSFLTLFKKEASGIKSAIREISPDVVFAQWVYHNAYAGLTSGYPCLVVAHDSPWRIALVERDLQSVIKAFYAQFLVFPILKFMTTVSPYMVDEFRRFNRYKGEIKVIPNGIEVPDHVVGKVGGRVPMNVVCVSQAGRRKNSATLFKAWDVLKRKHPEWRLKVYGQGMPEGMVQRAELDRILREEADLFVSPSLEESFGMVFVEAMRYGIPCIGGEKSGAVPWVMGDGGVVCDVRSPDKLAECIERVMGDFELRKRLSEGGLRRVREFFDINKVVDMYEAELARLSSEGLRKE